MIPRLFEQFLAGRQSLQGATSLQSVLRAVVAASGTAGSAQAPCTATSGYSSEAPTRNSPSQQPDALVWLTQCAALPGRPPLRGTLPCSMSAMPQVAGLHQPSAPSLLRHMSSSSSNDTSNAGGSPGSTGSAGQGQPGEDKAIRMSLQDALSKLVDAAVEMVEQNNLEGAISVLKEGIATFEPKFPGSPELGELHNQVALLALMGGDVEGAAHHAQVAHDMTAKVFGPTSALTGHRALRLGVARFAQGKLSEAAGLLQSAQEALLAKHDPSRHEARLYLDLIMLTGATTAAQVKEVESQLLSSFQEMTSVFGGQSMIVALGLSQHDRVVHQPLASPDPDVHLCEALLKQHIKLLEAITPDSEDLAISNYKLATFYYVNDILPDAAGAVRKATELLRASYPEEHDLVVLCKHRMGMICAASGDHRAATQLLAKSLTHYGGAAAQGAGPGSEGSEQVAPGGVSGLAREAQFGLALAKYRGLPASASDQQRSEALAAARTKLDELAAAIGTQHMLARGAMRYFAQANVMAGANKHG